MPDFVQKHNLAVAGESIGKRSEKHVNRIGGYGGLKAQPLMILCTGQRVVAHVAAEEGYRREALRNPAGDCESECQCSNPAPLAHRAPRPLELRGAQREREVRDTVV